MSIPGAEDLKHRLVGLGTWRGVLMLGSHVVHTAFEAGKQLVEMTGCKGRMRTGSPILELEILGIMFC
jgi:hypothetical protein